MTVGGRGVATATITSSSGGDRKATFETYESGEAHAAITSNLSNVDSEDDFDMPSTSGARKKQKTQTPDTKHQTPNKDQKPFYCNQCNATSYTEEAYNNHLKTSHEAKCEQCGRAFTRKSSLRRHIRNVHKPIEKL